MGKMQFVLLESYKDLNCERIEGLDRLSRIDFLIKIVVRTMIK